MSLPKPSPLETWRSWSAGWCSAASATGACPWTQQCPSTASEALSPTAWAECKVPRVCICRDTSGVCVGLWGLWGGKLCSPGALTQGSHAPPLLGAGEISCLCQILRPVPISASIRDIKFSADSAEGRVCFIGPWSLVTEATQPIWLLGAGLEARKFLTAPSKGSVPEVGADSSTACSLL